MLKLQACRDRFGARDPQQVDQREVRNERSIVRVKEWREGNEGGNEVEIMKGRSEEEIK